MKKVVLLSFVALSLTAGAQKVSNKLQFQKGQKLEMVTDVKSVISQEVMGQSMDINLNSNLTRVFDIEDVKNGSATIEHKIKRLQFNVDAMGQSQSFDSEKEADLKSETGKNIEKAIKNKYKMTVDASGKVTAVQADDNNPNGGDKSESADMMANMLEQFGADLNMPKIGDATTFKILPEREIGQGDSWVDSSRSTPETRTKTTYTVSGVTASDVVLDFVQEAKIAKVQEAMGTEANVNMNMKVTGKITLDRKTGLLKQRTSNTEGSGSVDVAGQSIPMSTKGTETTTIKASM